MKKLLLAIFSILVFLLVLSGCGKKTVGPEKNEVIEPVDWKKNGFVTTEEEAFEKQSLWVEDYISMKTEVEYDRATEKTYDTSYQEAGVYGGKLYRFYPVYNQAHQPKRWVLSSYDFFTGETQSFEYPMSIFTDYEMTDDHYAYCLVMEVIDETHFAMDWMEWEQNEEGFSHPVAERIIYLEGEQVTHSIDVWQTFLEKGIAEDTWFEGILRPDRKCIFDYAGNAYVSYSKPGTSRQELYVFDKSGATLLEYSLPQTQIMLDHFKTPEGEVIYVMSDNAKQGYVFLWPNLEQGKMQELAVLNNERSLRQVLGMQGKWIYYVNNQGIVRWDVLSGERTFALSYIDNGIASDYQSMMAFRDGETPQLRIVSRKRGYSEDWFVKLSNTEIKRKEDIRVVDLVAGGQDYGCQMIAECAALVTRRNRKDFFAYEKSDGDRNDYRTKLLTELIAGKGPDILYVSREDMEILQDKGLLLDLRELISEERLEDILPGALDLGTIDGKLVGMPLCIQADGLAVSEGICEKEAWTLQDIVYLMQSGKLNKGIYYPAGRTWFAAWGAASTIMYNCINDSELIDWETEKCHMNEKLLLTYLEMTNVDRESLMDDGEIGRIAYVNIHERQALLEFGLVDIQNPTTAYTFIGYPTDGASGNYLKTNGVVVVNKNSTRISAIAEYLDKLFSDEILQMGEYFWNTPLSVQKLNLDELEWEENGTCSYNGQEMYVFPDGTTSLHRAKEFLEKCVAMPKQRKEIDTIIDEELPTVYKGNKTIKQMLDIIQSRVQLYLDEN